jgi:hypothetical protein
MSHHLHQFHLLHHLLLGCYTSYVKRATITLPSDPAEAVGKYIRAQEVPPALTTVLQIALRDFLRKRGFLPLRRPSED